MPGSENQAFSRCLQSIECDFCKSCKFTLDKSHYISVTRLFNVHDRIAALELCEMLNEEIENGGLKDIDTCFLPYRDSNEMVKDKKNKTYEIFKMDCESVRNSIVLVGYLDGPNYDSGIGFEIGYAYVLGKKIIIMNSDYFFVKRDDSDNYSICSLLQSMAKVIHIREGTDNINYRDGLFQLRKSLWKNLICELNHHQEEIHVLKCDKTEKFEYYIDPAFSYNEPGKEILKKLEVSLKTREATYCVGRNIDYVNFQNLLKYMKNCDKVIIYSEGFELGIESSIMQGVAYALGKKIYLYATDKLNLFQNEEFVLFKNPMIEHSAYKILSSYKDIY